MALLIVSCKNEKTISEEQKHDHTAPIEKKVEESKKKPLSPHTETMAMIGEAHIHIDYSSYDLMVVSPNVLNLLSKKN